MSINKSRKLYQIFYYTFCIPLMIIFSGSKKYKRVIRSNIFHCLKSLIISFTQSVKRININKYSHTTILFVNNIYPST